MFVKIVLSNFLLMTVILAAHNDDGPENKVKTEEKSAVVELNDEKWDPIQKGQWLIGFFDAETEESKELEESWLLLAHKCKKLNINVGHVFAPQNPGLYVRFLVTIFPKVFYIKNGVAHEIPKVSEKYLMELIDNGEWSKLKPVNFLSNPFSVQMSLLSHLFIHAVNLYNFENSIVQKFVSAPSATDAVFGLTFIIVGTILGLLMTCAFGVLQIIFMDSKEPEEVADNKKNNDKIEEIDSLNEGESRGKSSNVRKRK